MSNIDSQLSQAYELIEADRASEAQAILKPLLDEYPDNPDLWWLYAHSVEDQDEAERALNNVSRLNPDHDGLEPLMAEFRQERKKIAPLSARLAEDDLFADEDDDDFLDDLDDDFLDDVSDDPEASTVSNPTPASSRRGLIGVLLVAIFLIILILVVLVINPFASNDDDEATNVAGNPTEPVIVDPTADVMDTVIEETQEVADSGQEADGAIDATEDAGNITSQASVGDYADLINGLSNLNVIADDTMIVNTQLGSTLLISVCTSAGDVLRDDLTEAMQAVSPLTSNIAEDAVGFRLVDCENGDLVLNTIAAPLESVAAFNDGALDEANFRGTWQAVG
ncbi:MAG: hypothetical protein RLP44_03200 [Aggregatilineales bacterium]